MKSDVNEPYNSGFKKKLIKAAQLFSIIAVALILLLTAGDVFLLIFAGLLLAVFLVSIAQFTSRITGLSYVWSVAVVYLAIVSGIVVVGSWAAPSVAEQFDELTRKVPESLEKIKSSIQHYSWAKSFLNEAEPDKYMGSGKDVLSKATGAVSGIFGAIANIVIILFVGLYGAVEPGIYKKGFLYLFPLDRRERVETVLNEIGHILRWWLIGKFASMSIIGVLTTFGLWLLDVPLALILGIIAALLTFIPNIGPLVSAVPAILLGLIDGPKQALYIAVLYVAIQTVESYLVTPVIQRKTISMPPGLTLGVQVLLGVLFSGLGVALATPITAVALVVTKRFYIEDTLGDHLEPATTEEK